MEELTVFAYLSEARPDPAHRKTRKLLRISSVCISLVRFAILDQAWCNSSSFLAKVQVTPD